MKIKRDGDKVVYQGDKGDILTLDENTVVSMNIWGFMPSLFDYLEEEMMYFLEENISSLKAEFLLPHVIDKLIKTGKVNIPVLETKAQWFGMTYKEDREIVRDKLTGLVKEGLYPSPIWQG